MTKRPTIDAIRNPDLPLLITDDSRISLHTLWAQPDVAPQASPIFDALLQTLRTRFRLATAVIIMAQRGKILINLFAGHNPQELVCGAALAMCHGQADQLLVLEDVPGGLGLPVHLPMGPTTELLTDRATNRATEPATVRFYAGAPLVISPGGEAVGMLCLLGTSPQGFSRADRLLLTSLALAVSTALLMPHNPAAAQAIALSAEKSVLLLGDTQAPSAVNARFTQLTGFTIDDLERVGLDDLLCLDRPNSGALLIQHALLTEVPAHGMTRCYTKSGGTLPVEVFVIPLHGPRGRVVKTLLVLAPVFSGTLENFLLSLKSTERSELLSLHVAGLWSADSTGAIVKLSGAPTAHLEASKQAQLQGKRLDQAGIFDAALTDWRAFYQSIANLSLPEEQECCVTHNGHTQWFSMMSFWQYGAGGQAIGYHGSFRDITRRKLKENALRKSEERQRLILKGTNDGAWDWDMETGDYYLSPRWWSMMGRDPLERLPSAKIWLAFIHPDDRQRVVANFKAAAQQGLDAYQSEFRMRHADGHYIAVLGRGHILRNAEGKAVRTSGTNQDLTGQRQAQAHIRLLQSCVESLHDVVLITHASPRKAPGPIIAYVNPAFERFTGYTSLEAIGNTPRMLQGPLTSRQTLDTITAAMTAWQPVRCELANYKKNGELFWMDLEIFPIKAEGSDWFTHWIGVQRDITDRKRAEQAKRATLMPPALTAPDSAALLAEGMASVKIYYEALLAKQLEEKQAHMAHELHDSLGSQLAGIGLQADTIGLLGGANPQLAMQIERLQVHIKKASEITRDLARGLMPVDAWPGSFWRALQRLCHDFDNNPTLRCTFDMDGNFDAVSAETGTHLYRIAQEAITNALRHGRATQIAVQLTQTPNHDIMRITDNGAGFDATAMPPNPGVGLRSIHARALAIGAEVGLTRQHPHGFCVEISCPKPRL